MAVIHPGMTFGTACPGQNAAANEHVILNGTDCGIAKIKYVAASMVLNATTTTTTTTNETHEYELVFVGGLAADSSLVLSFSQPLNNDVEILDITV